MEKRGVDNVLIKKSVLSDIWRIGVKSYDSPNENYLDESGKWGKVDNEK